MVYYSTKNMSLFFLVIIISAKKTQSVVRDCPVACFCHNHTNNIQSGNHSGTYYIEVKCTGQYWTHIPMLPNGNVTKLYMGQKKSIHITTLPDHVFKENKGVHLETINLQYSEINDIGLHAFQALKNLQNLRISGKLTHLRSGIFKGLPRLISINLGGNLFTDIPESAICDAHNLRDLYLINNKITRLLFRPCFGNLKHLSTCYLKGNPVKEINPEDLAVLKTLPISVLHLSDCQLTRLQQNTLKGFSNLVSLYLENNRIKIMSYQFVKISPLLTNIDLSGNKITRVSGNIFANLTNLKNVGLQTCGLQTATFPSDFQELTEFHELSLTGNPLHNLSDNSFKNVRNLTSLVLASCKLQFISPGAF